MFVVRMDGGLGNQLFQYAFYRYLGTITDPQQVWVDNNCYNPHQSQTMYDYYSITPRQADEGLVRYFHRNGFWHLFRLTDRLGIGKPHYYWERDGVDIAALPLDKKIYLRGCWQRAEYPEAVAESLRKELDPERFLRREGESEALLSQNCRMLEKIEGAPSVAIHIRGGDYLTDAAWYGGICDAAYYSRAVAYVRERIPGLRIFLFTNEMSYAKRMEEAWRGTECIPVEINDEEHGHLDLLLMSRCRHQIIANSTFSWWAAWLNKAADKMVLMPSRWDKEREGNELRCADWIVI